VHRAIHAAADLFTQHHTVLLMPSIFPDPDSAAGEPIRDEAGNCLNPPDVHNAYCPAPGYITTCPITALPSDCNARIEPRQINAIISELISFAECLDPDGPWDCTKLNNICAAFTQWAILNVGVLISDTPPDYAKPRQLWWESDTGVLFLKYDDGNSVQWVQVSGNDNNVDLISIIGSGSIANPHKVALVDCGSY
jgi:hypothetical protein